MSNWDLDLWPKITNFNRVRASVVSSHLARTASKSVHPFSWNFVYKQSRTHRQTHTQTNCSENITPPQFRWGVKSEGPYARLNFVDTPENAYFLKFMKMRCFHIFNDFDHKDKLIIMSNNLTLLDGVCQKFQVKILTTFSNFPKICFLVIVKIFYFRSEKHRNMFFSQNLKFKPSLNFLQGCETSSLSFKTIKSGCPLHVIIFKIYLKISTNIPKIWHFLRIYQEKNSIR